MNEVAKGYRKDILPKPDELKRYELMKSTGLPLVAGGLLDQPHIWLRQWRVIESVVKMFEHTRNESAGSSQPKNLMAPMTFGK